MSLFSRAKSFVEGAVISADDFEAEFDNIGDAINDLLPLGGRVNASEALTLTTAYQDVPGTSKTITAAQDSIVLVWIDANVTGAISSYELAVNVDGTDQTPATATETGLYAVAVSKGSRTIKLRAKASGAGTVSTATSYIYLLIPNPDA